jgi:C4-dicarboxylate-specific signal transduction histidine kinase
MRKIVLVLVFMLFAIVPATTYAQCAMCRATLETHAKSGENKASGLNTAIGYLLVLPYIAGGVFWYLWKINKKKNDELNRQIVSRLHNVDTK